MHETATSLPFVAEPTPWSKHAHKVHDEHVLEALSPQFDCVIVGAGFTGLACARRLATFRPDWKIAILDALCVGQGASGRNSGFVMDLGHWQSGWSDLSPQCGVVPSYSYYSVCRAWFWVVKN